jgi:hypothetical protein
MNTVLLPIAWETIEPEEGKFNFGYVDGLLEGARENHLKLVVLWFGAWKNTYSSYVPAWVKTNIERFPRVQMSNGIGTERLSPFSTPVRDADAHAFANLMRHLRDADGDAHTVLMVQVENEVGVIPESRDHSPVANASFTAAVPSALTNFLEKHRTTLNPELRAAWEAEGAKTAGTWQEVFGKTSLTDDLFMAWRYATYIEHVAAAGKAEYPLPMYANAALIRPNYEPGQYNSGGPLPHSMDIWRAGAPSLDFISPDIYFNEFALWAGWYARPGNPLFIPEAQGGAPGAANILYAFGRLSAIGFSAFGVDDQDNTPLDLVGITNPAEHPRQWHSEQHVCRPVHAGTVSILQRERRCTARLAYGQIDLCNAFVRRRDLYPCLFRIIHERQGRFFCPCHRGQSSHRSMNIVRLLVEKIWKHVVMRIDCQIHVGLFVLSSQDHPGCFSSDHMCGRICGRGSDSRDDRRISNPHAKNAMNAKLRIDYGEPVDPHLAGTNGMTKARRSCTGKVTNVIGSHLWARDDFALTNAVKSGLPAKFACHFDGLHDRCEILLVTEVVPINDDGILPVCTCQPYRSSAGRLH